MMNQSPGDNHLPPSATTTIGRTDAAIHVLNDLESVLEAESSALAKLDFAAIDRTTQQKVALESRLEAALGALDTVSPSAAQRESLLELRQRVGKQARHNQGRLEATLWSVKGLLAELTSDAPSTYGPAGRSGGITSPVLTSSVG